MSTSRSAEQSSKSVFSSYAAEADLIDLIATFVGTMPEKQRTMEALFRTGQVDDLRTMAHQLKGSGGGYGFGGLSQMALVLEQACKENDIDRVGRALDELIGYMDRVHC